MKAHPSIPLSGGEMSSVVWQQQEQIRGLSLALLELEQRLNTLQNELDLIRQAQLPPSEIAEMRREIERATRDALRHLDDAGYLSDCRLAELIAELNGRPIGGYHLHCRLRRAIDALETTEALAEREPGYSHFEILRLTYREKKRAAEVARQLAMSDRQYYRQLKVAILAVADQILGL